MVQIRWPFRLDKRKIRLEGISTGHLVYLANPCWDLCTAKLVTNMENMDPSALSITRRNKEGGEA